MSPRSHRSTTIPANANLLIRRLAAEDQGRLVAACEPVAWRLAEVLCEPGAPLRHAYFPLSGFLSLVTQAASGPSLEVGMVGREGVLGAELALGVQHAPFHVLVQGAGSALRIASDALLAEMARSASLREALKRYTGVTLSQLATSAACLRQHPARARLARWVLMSQDRAQADQFAMTSVFLAYMLGEPRPAIASALAELQQRHLITREGDTMAVTDRAGLESAACSCYQAERSHYQHHLGL
ncbi:MAG: Crp/Fnr family transcriptional regulator [Hydrogenophaga sp.]|nr:Crp/Fnr family transcriptional regulator [Hydrogenophaga sp.]